MRLTNKALRGTFSTCVGSLETFRRSEAFHLLQAVSQSPRGSECLRQRAKRAWGGHTAHSATQLECQNYGFQRRGGHALCRFHVLPLGYYYSPGVLTSFRFLCAPSPYHLWKRRSDYPAMPLLSNRRWILLSTVKSYCDG